MLSVRGTELSPTSQLMVDWIVNLTQGLNGDDESYEAGILLTWALNSMDFMKAPGFSLTGHSMGGGIASAASIVNNVPAVVFNAAGVHEKSIVQDDGSAIIPGGVAPNFLNANKLISHFYVAMQDDGSVLGDTVWNTPDILTFLSMHVAAMPNPPGNLIPIEGLYNLNRPDLVQKGIGELGRLPARPISTDFQISIIWDADLVAKLLHYFSSDIGGMIRSHNLDSVFFGLLHYDVVGFPSWNAYDDLNPDTR